MPLSVWLVSLLSSAAPPPAPTYTGFWLTEDQTTVVEISRQGGGYVAFRQDPTSARHRASANFPVLKELKLDGDELNGNKLNPDISKDYNACCTSPAPKL